MEKEDLPEKNDFSVKLLATNELSKTFSNSEANQNNVEPKPLIISTNKVSTMVSLVSQTEMQLPKTDAQKVIEVTSSHPTPIGDIISNGSCIVKPANVIAVSDLKNTTHGKEEELSSMISARKEFKSDENTESFSIPIVESSNLTMEQVSSHSSIHQSTSSAGQKEPTFLKIPIVSKSKGSSEGSRLRFDRIKVVSATDKSSNSKISPSLQGNCEMVTELKQEKATCEIISKQADNDHQQFLNSALRDAFGPTVTNLKMDKEGSAMSVQPTSLEEMFQTSLDDGGMGDDMENGIIELSFNQNAGTSVIDVNEQIKQQSNLNNSKDMYVVQVDMFDPEDPDSISLNLPHTALPTHNKSITIELETGDLQSFASKNRKCRKRKTNELNGSSGATQQPIKRRATNIDPSLQELLPKGSCKYELSSRGSKKLIDPQGYSYNVKAVNVNINVVYWQCSIRPKKDPCRASLIEKADGCFVVGRHPHNHQVAPGAALASRVIAAVKEKAAYEIYKPAQMIVRDVLDDSDIVAPVVTDHLLPPMRSLIRSANRYRKSLRPTEPNDIEFKLDTNHLPADFFRVDLRYDVGRHLIFATNEQLTALAHAESWFADITPASCRAPFKQLFTLTAFIGEEADGSLVNIKLAPLVYVLMSTAKSPLAYTTILNELVQALPQMPLVQRVAAAHDKDLWKAFETVLPNVKVRVCSYYYMRSVWKKASQLGILDGDAQQQAEALEIVRRYLTLPFLPAADVPDTFRMLQSKANSHPLASFARYMQRSWVGSKTVSSEQWSSFDEVVRLDTDVNGWRSALVERRSEMRSRMPFYLLVLTLHRETETLAQSCLVDDARLKSRPLRGFQLSDYWERYNAMGDRRSPYELATECTRMLPDNLAMAFNGSV